MLNNGLNELLGVCSTNFRFHNTKEEDLAEEEESTQYYYNVEVIDNGYILKYTQVTELENLTDNFVLLNNPIYKIPNFLEPLHDRQVIGGTALNMPFIEALVLQYKKQIFEEKQKEIVDPYFEQNNYLMYNQYLSNTFAFSGLKLGRNGVIRKYVKKNFSEEALKIKEEKRQEKEKIQCKENNARCVLQSMFENYFQKELKIYLKLPITKANLYNVLTHFESFIKNISFTKLKQYCSWEDDESIELIQKWVNNPELARFTPKSKRKPSND